MNTDTSNFSFQGIGVAGDVSVYGCMDPAACNYDPLAVIEDNSCILLFGCTDPNADNYDATVNAQCDDGSCDYSSSIVNGCTDPTAFNYDPSANTDDGSCIPCINGCTDITAVNFDTLATCDDGSCIGNVYGCTDDTACNFNPSATSDDGSCTYYGCMDPGYMEYDASATCPCPEVNGVSECCITLLLYGCTDPTAFNYSSAANQDDGSCIAVVNCCTDPNATNHDPNANVNDGSCTYEGCTDPLADNYDPTATIDDGSCRYSGCVNGMDVAFILDYNWGMAGIVQTLKWTGASQIGQAIANETAAISGTADYQLALITADQWEMPFGYINYGNGPDGCNYNFCPDFSYSADKNMIDTDPNADPTLSYQQVYNGHLWAAFYPNNKNNFQSRMTKLNGGGNNSWCVHMGDGLGSGTGQCTDWIAKRITTDSVPMLGTFSGWRGGVVAKWIVIITNRLPGHLESEFTPNVWSEIQSLISDGIANQFKYLVFGPGVDLDGDDGNGNLVYPWRELANQTGGSYDANANPSTIISHIQSNCN